jgi:hypothetical protein
MKLWLYLKLQGHFGYENDRTHVINVVVLVVKIIIQLTYGIHGFKKKKHTTTRLFNKMTMQVPQESAEKKYLGHRMLFTLENQRSHRRKALITKIV